MNMLLRFSFLCCANMESVSRAYYKFGRLTTNLNITIIQKN